MRDIKKIKKVHFIGIGGIGVSAAAKLMLELGKVVTGSDAGNSEIIEDLKKRGVNVFIGSSARNVTKDIDLIVYSPAVPETDVERERAKKLGIIELGYPEFLGFLSKLMCTVAISGTNGKSTATSMLGLILEKAGMDPTVIVGSKVKSFDGNLRVGKFLKEDLNLTNSQTNRVSLPEMLKKIFVVEGCEYRAAMLNLSPHIIVLTNIEEDHLDYYKDLEHIKKTFRKYIAKVEKNGLLVFNADDNSSKDLIADFNGYTISYGVDIFSNFTLSRKNNLPDVMANNIRIKNQRQLFDVSYKSKILGEIKLRIPGTFNVYNALAAIAASLALGVEFRIIKESLDEFRGIWRRFEIVGELNGATVISDYGHHPTAIRETLRAAKEFYPKRRLVIVFQPHSHNRTKKLFNEFAISFDQANEVILTEVYDVAGRENQADKVSGEDLARTIENHWKNRKFYARKQNSIVDKGHRNVKKTVIEDNCRNILYVKNLDESKRVLLKNIRKNDVIIIMGAGDIYKMIDGLLKPKSTIY